MSTVSHFGPPNFHLLITWYWWWFRNPANHLGWLKPYTNSAKGPWNKSLNFIFPMKYVIPKSLKVGHWLRHPWFFKTKKLSIDPCHNVWFHFPGKKWWCCFDEDLELKLGHLKKKIDPPNSHLWIQDICDASLFFFDGFWCWPMRLLEFTNVDHTYIYISRYWGPPKHWKTSGWRFS